MKIVIKILALVVFISVMSSCSEEEQVEPDFSEIHNILPSGGGGGPQNPGPSPRPQ